MLTKKELEIIYESMAITRKSTYHILNTAPQVITPELAEKELGFDNLRAILETLQNLCRDRKAHDYMLLISPDTIQLCLATEPYDLESLFPLIFGVEKWNAGLSESLVRHQVWLQPMEADASTMGVKPDLHDALQLLRTLWIGLINHRDVKGLAELWTRFVVQFRVCLAVVKQEEKVDIRTRQFVLYKTFNNKYDVAIVSRKENNEVEVEKLHF